MKVLVTGAAGFIGSALTLRLLERGDTVVGIDNHNDYYDPKLKQDRLARQIDHINYTHIRGDIADRQTMETLFTEQKPQRVVNLAAQAGVRYSLENPLAYIDSNLVGFGHILEGCRHRPATAYPDWQSDNPDSGTSYAPWRIYNIGSNNPESLNTYIETLENFLGKTAQKELLPLQPGDVPDTYADVDDLIRDIGYKPDTPLEQGM
ncbi:NAD-dependent epimerase/dehydratase family protein [Ectothiorhodospiraceae bacterium BW-2]|nr:NAD-dependent epimerase/dehydratase family protein [Ectothiorhodospiraceae bacterium BW-2]